VLKLKEEIIIPTAWAVTVKRKVIRLPGMTDFGLRNERSGRMGSYYGRKLPVLVFIANIFLFFF